MENSLVFETLTLDAWNKKVSRALAGLGVIFGTYNELPLHLQLNATTWYLYGFQGNHSYINDVISGRHLGHYIFQILSKLELDY